MRMGSMMLRHVMVGMVVLWSAYSCAAAGWAAPWQGDPPTITVSGTAEIQVVPDHANLRFSIDSRSTELAAAVEDHNSKVSAVIGFLKDSDIDPKYIRTERIRIQPIYKSKSKASYAQQSVQIEAQQQEPSIEDQIQPIGYSVRRQISVRINDLDSFEIIYQGLIGRGVNEVDQLTFQTSELRKHRDDARLKAVRAAREKATAMAQELDCELAAVQSITENQRNWRGANIQNTISVVPGDASGSVASGMIEITATVNVVFILGQVDLGE